MYPNWFYVSDRTCTVYYYYHAVHCIFYATTILIKGIRPHINFNFIFTFQVWVAPLEEVLKPFQAPSIPKASPTRSSSVSRVTSWLGDRGEVACLQPTNDLDLVCLLSTPRGRPGEANVDPVLTLPFGSEPSLRACFQAHTRAGDTGTDKEGATSQPFTTHCPC